LIFIFSFTHLKFSDYFKIKTRPKKYYQINYRKEPWPAPLPGMFFPVKQATFTAYHRKEENEKQLSATAAAY